MYFIINYNSTFLEFQLASEIYFSNFVFKYSLGNDIIRYYLVLKFNNKNINILIIYV